MNASVSVLPKLDTFLVLAFWRESPVCSRFLMVRSSPASDSRSPRPKASPRPAAAKAKAKSSPRPGSYRARFRDFRNKPTTYYVMRHAVKTRVYCKRADRVELIEGTGPAVLNESTFEGMHFADSTSQIVEHPIVEHKSKFKKDLASVKEIYLKLCSSKTFSPNIGMWRLLCLNVSRQARTASRMSRVQSLIELKGLVK